MTSYDRTIQQSSAVESRSSSGMPLCPQRWSSQPRVYITNESWPAYYDYLIIILIMLFFVLHLRSPQRALVCLTEEQEEGYVISAAHRKHPAINHRHTICFRPSACKGISSTSELVFVLKLTELTRAYYRGRALSTRLTASCLPSNCCGPVLRFITRCGHCNT
ncbi:hypothetical protein F5X98DRAFT_259983 [Xylaria grammica]|nr:hypothetical protein F5X98DRAFT_259983 [Xylaria grammica]